MSRRNGGIIGKRNLPSGESASGVWHLNSVQEAQTLSSWPFIPPPTLYVFEEMIITDLYGRTGSSLSTIVANTSGASSDNWKNNTAYFNATNGIISWIVPGPGTYRIEAKGACGSGIGSRVPGNGAILQGDFDLVSGEEIKIVVGQKIGASLQQGSNGGGGGGGGTFVVKSNNTALIIAGGGGGTGHHTSSGFDASTSTSGVSGGAGSIAGGAGGTSGGCGAAGVNSNSTEFVGAGGGGFINCQGGSWVWSGNPTYFADGGFGFQAGGNGGGGYSGYSFDPYNEGGFGGGGGGSDGGGGGGGYSGGGGGGGGSTSNGGGGGGSYNIGANQSASVGNQATGYLKITLLP